MKFLNFIKNKWVIISLVAFVAVCAIVIPIACVFGRKKSDPITNIKIDTTDTKIVFELGEEFSSDGLVVRKVLASGNENKFNDYTINSDDFDNSTIGDYVITITYQDFSDTYTVSVVDNSDEVVDIFLDTTNVKTIYDYRETFSSVGLIVRSITEKGKTQVLQSKDFTVNSEAFNNNRTGEYEIVVAYGNFEKKYKVNVVELAKNVISMSIDTTNVTKVFNLNDANGFNSNGLIVRTKTESGVETEISSFSIDTNGFDISKEGIYTIKVKYSAFEKTYDVEVKKLVDVITHITLDTSAVKTEFKLGDRFSSQGLIVRTKTESGVEKRITNYSLNYSAFNNWLVGSYDIIVSYEGLTAKYTISVVDDPIVAISLDTSLAKTIYNPGETFSSTGLIVYSIRQSGAKNRINLNDITIDRSAFNADNTTLGTRTITVNYSYSLRSYAQTYTVRIVEDAVTHFNIDTSNVKKVFILNEEFNADNLIVRLVKNSGVETIITEGYTIDDVDLSEVNDEITVTVRYGTFPAQTYTISVIDPTTEDIKGFSIDTSNVTKVFNLNDKNCFNADGLIVRSITNSNKEMIITNSDDITINSDEFDITNEGEYTIYITYKDFEPQTYTVKVVRVETFIAIELDTTNVTKEFSYGSEFEANGLIVYKVSDSGNKFITTDYIIDSSAFNSSEAGTKTIVVKLTDDEDISESYEVTVKEAKVTLTVIDTTSEETNSNVKIYVNGIEQTTSTIVIDKNTEITLTFIVPEGYLFNGWFEGEDYDVSQDTPLSTEIEYSFNIDRTITLSAVASIKTYSVTFTGLMPDGETPIDEELFKSGTYNYNQQLPEITGTDTIKFDGWKIVLEGGELGTEIYNTAIFENSSVTLTPAYSNIEVTPPIE